jgi:hypothetical protein
MGARITRASRTSLKNQLCKDRCCAKFPAISRRAVWADRRKPTGDRVSDEFLRLEVRLLVLRYGKQQVLRALAAVGDQTIDDLEQQIAAAESNRKKKTRKAPLTAVELAAVESKDKPIIAETLRRLAIAFDNRAFLPQLRDVERFLERGGSPKKKFKSRAAAAPALFHALGQMSHDDLVRLSSQRAVGNESDYSLLARTIMRPGEKS